MGRDTDLTEKTLPCHSNHFVFPSTTLCDFRCRQEGIPVLSWFIQTHIYIHIHLKSNSYEFISQLTHHKSTYTTCSTVNYMLLMAKAPCSTLKSHFCAFALLKSGCDTLDPHVWCLNSILDGQCSQSKCGFIVQNPHVPSFSRVFFTVCSHDSPWFPEFSFSLPCGQQPVCSGKSPFPSVNQRFQWAIFSRDV